MKFAATRRAKKLDERRRAMRFFAEHGSGVVGEAALTGYKLELAEEIAEELNWITDWELDPEPDLSWCDKCESDSDHRADHASEVYCATLMSDERVPIVSIGGIDRPSKIDRRVEEAQLALEALTQEHAGPRESLTAFLKNYAEEFIRAAERVDRARIAQRITAPHARCADSPRCVEHAHDRRVPSCKRRKGRVRPR